MRLFLTMALAASTLLCSVNAQTNRIDAIRPDAPTLAPYGTAPVGVRTLKFVHAGQVDVVNTKAGEANRTYDRPLTVEVWYPAQLGTTAGTAQYVTVTRDGKTATTLTGRAARDAAPDTRSGPYPLVIVSHGYPGNRFLLSPLAENLASKGYVVAAIDHTDSTYSDQAAFASTLLNRPLDQLFVLNELSRVNSEPGTLQGLMDVNRTALIGYSMGGYGVMNTIGAGFTAASVTAQIAPPNGLLAQRQAGNAAYTSSMDPRIKAAIAIAPWGWNAGFWSADTLKGVRTPVLFMAGSVDDVSGYQPGIRNLFEGAVNADRYLLTFENANHNAAAPMPAPAEVWRTGAPFAHYADPVWDSVRMNNIAQHFATAFLGRYLRGDASMDKYLNLVEYARDGRFSVGTDGTPKADHTYWQGFENRTAAGLRFEHLPPQKP
ncbi:alpha/beta hydrolase family protein [Deinococcus maricopensis]|uniref:Dienelactone hydrolase n=1 Tax=Deinococcus maricopensis (strain DSM 21211 / LMG 22137 / NRRL B-23946 / LB-34) TaxID=709986 RepID=E8U3B0_DEIML|nr:dienelactone hydrolase [Deinococcus maricopensis]ADV65781.1 hypothetical protein Deima_0117 [Deinococcus maricopensis DSM 21211]